MAPKVLIATPNYTNTFSAEAHQSHMLCVQDWTERKIDFKWMITGRTFVHFARTQACEVALMAGFTHILWLDDDAVIDPALLPKYLAFDKEIVITPYFMRRPPFECGVLKSTTGNFHDHRSYKNLTIADLDQGLIEVDGGGTHAMLIKTSVLTQKGMAGSPESLDPKLKDLIDRLSPADREIIDHNVGTLPDARMSLEEEHTLGIKPYFQMPKTGTEDMLFCYRVKCKGVKVWCDTDATAGHIGFAPVITKAFRIQAEAVLDGEKAATVVHRIKPNDISAGTESKGVSSARHEAVDMAKSVSML